MQSNIIENDYAALVLQALNLAEAMIINGAEVSRIEDSIKRIFKSYGAKSVDVLTITSSIILTVTFADGTAVTHTKRITSSNIDFEVLSKLNQLCRTICAETPSPEEIGRRIDEINAEAAKTSKYKRTLKKLAGYIFASGGFAVFFGGDAVDFAITSVIAAVIVLFEQIFKRKDSNLATYYFACTFIAALLTVLFCRVFSRESSDAIMIGFIMLIIPGITFTNSARDFLLGDTISGSLRMLESILFAACIAAGVAAALVLTGGAI